MAKLTRKTEAITGAGEEGGSLKVTSAVPGGRQMFGLSDKDMEIFHIPVASIVPSRYQPRRIFSVEAMESLTSSLAEKGLIQAICVIPFDPSGYEPFEGMPEEPKWELVFGERRWRAAKTLGWEFIPATKGKGDTAALVVIENLQREDLDPLEEAEALERLMKIEGLDQNALAKRLNCSQPTISVALRMLKLPELIKEEFRGGLRDKVSQSALILVAEEKDPEDQLTLWNSVKDGATVKQIREERDTLRKNRAGGQTRTAPAWRSLDVQARTFAGNAEKKLAEMFGESRPNLDEESRGRLTALRDRLNHILSPD